MGFLYKYTFAYHIYSKHTIHHTVSSVKQNNANFPLENEINMSRAIISAVSDTMVYLRNDLLLYERQSQCPCPSIVYFVASNWLSLRCLKECCNEDLF